ncbi:hypothetical protein PROFUN_02867 [Planoprotostelium fungivorum]|uniref:EF-hand domain-containing protein n=1 Tax=Planoprotostelium fungivorum TaxID=1890364 RepID=A0A2P6NS71_9EUKA|nr:hypothetical protein PROFUN_02867 [Planoprotostelium fungivorum]
MTTPKPPLIDKKSGDFTQKAQKAFEEIFARFDQDKDGALNSVELDAFATACNGTPFDDSSKQEIIDYFDVTDDNALTLKGFLEMYHTQTSGDSSETWKDLTKLGYNGQLEKK